MKIDLIMPTARHHLLPQVQACLDRALATAPDIDLVWWLVTYDWEAKPEETPGLEWRDNMRSIRVPYANFQPVMHLMNVALDRLSEDPARADTWVWMAQDDNLAFAGRVFNHLADTVAAYPDARVLVMNHNRGQHGVSHGAAPLLARGDHMHVGYVSLEQYVIHQSVHQHERYISDGCGDGEIMARLWAKMPERFHFMTGTWLPYNALEAGRWDADALTRALEDCGNGA